MLCARAVSLRASRRRAGANAAHLPRALAGLGPPGLDAPSAAAPGRPGAASTAGAAGKWWYAWEWPYLRRGVRVARACGLAGSLYGAGYAAGMHNYGADPQGVREGQKEQVLRGLGAITEDGRARLCDRSSSEVRSVQQVLPRVLTAAREHVRALHEALEEEIGRAGLTQDRHVRLQKLQRARVQLDSWRDDDFIVVDLNTPNAFVHALVPRMVFIHRGLFYVDHFVDPRGNPAALAAGARVAIRDAYGRVASARVVACPRESEGAREVVVACNDGVKTVAMDSVRLVERRQGIVQSHEQLAMLLSHEISHVIHDHSGDMTTVVAVAAGCQLVLLALLDPTGLFSFLAEAGMAVIATFGFRLPHSRAGELEADSTGLQICASAMYDPRDATTFFSHMLADEAEGAGQGRSPGPEWASTHPSTGTRLQALRRAEEEAVLLYENARQRASWFPSLRGANLRSSAWR